MTMLREGDRFGQSIKKTRIRRKKRRRRKTKRKMTRKTTRKLVERGRAPKLSKKNERIGEEGVEGEEKENPKMLVMLKIVMMIKIKLRRKAPEHFIRSHQERTERDTTVRAKISK